MKLNLRRPNSWEASVRLNQHVRFFNATRRPYSQGLQTPGRQLRASFWIPQASLAQKSDGSIDVNQLLVQAGYFRQAYSGIFHMLPLGLRVQTKIENLVDKHMQSLQASKVSLSSISSQKLWERSGRFQKGSEFFKFRDRKDGEWILAPTHEEEITSVVKDVVHAPGHLPIRLYQISRKYRDEKRPRGGLLRGREFIMKDLYTFDKTEAEAHATYANVREAYKNLFDELKLPYIEARADSGNMGGSLSHEFHFPSNLGEDDVIHCSTCEYAKNEEFVPAFTTQVSPISDHAASVSNPASGPSQVFVSQDFLSKDRNTLIKAYVSINGDGEDAPSLNPFAVKEAMNGHAEVDTGVEDALGVFNKRLDQGIEPEKLNIYFLFDQLATSDAIAIQIQKDHDRLIRNSFTATVVRIDDRRTVQSHLARKRTGDACPDCTVAGRDGALSVTKAIEVGHTFHLGDRYSSKLDLVVPGAGQKDGNTGKVYVSMGCHGIGVSRLIAAVASALSDRTGLIWPRALAPFEVLIVVNKKQKDLAESVDVGNQIYDDLSQHKESPIDVLIDDRDDVDFGWKLKDADLIGYPVLVVIGKGWLKNKLVELQCRRLKVNEEIPLEDVAGRVRHLLSQL